MAKKAKPTADPAEEFKKYLAEFEFRGGSPKTVALYTLRVMPYITAAGWGDQHALIEHLRRYKNERTKAQAFRAIKTFVRWGAKNNLCVDYATSMHHRFPTAPQREPLSVEDLERILAACPDTISGRRNRTLYWTLLFTGARRDAIRTLTWDRVNLDDGSVSFRTKGRVEQAIPLAPRCLDALKAWRAECPSEKYVFPSIGPGNALHDRGDKTIDANYISHQLRFLALKARFPRPVNVHLLRHSHVVIMADAGVPYETIRMSTGHTTNTMLEHYDRKNPARLRKALDRVFGEVSAPAATPPPAAPPKPPAARVVAIEPKPKLKPAPAALAPEDVADWI